MTTTAKNITDDQIRKLRAEAAEVGDHNMVEYCDLAIDGPTNRMQKLSNGNIANRLGARHQCAQVIAAAEAQKED